MSDLSYAVNLAQRLIRCPSVTPAEGGALDLLQAECEALGFHCTRLPFGDGDARIDNLYAEISANSDKQYPHFAFAGHTDVVPVGNVDDWSSQPFDGDVKDGQLYGRGAADMKGGIACFVAAVKSHIESGQDHGRISLVITGDEEGDAINGTVKMVDWMRDHGLSPDMCLVGEPTNPEILGDVIKNGRRGSLSGHLRVSGVQGHVAYPHLANNPMPALMDMLAPVNSTELDGGTAYFDPSTAQIVSLETPNAAGNVIPQTVEAIFNIRFNTEHSVDSLTGWLDEHFARVADKRDVQFTARWKSNAAPFVTEPGALTDALQAAIKVVTGRTASLSTSGGTSDARFLCKLGPVAEFGLVGQTMHKVDEHVAIDDIDQLTAIYSQLLASLKSAT